MAHLHRLRRCINSTAIEREADIARASASTTPMEASGWNRIASSHAASANPHRRHDELVRSSGRTACGAAIAEMQVAAETDAHLAQPCAVAIDGDVRGRQ